VEAGNWQDNTDKTERKGQRQVLTLQMVIVWRYTERMPTEIPKLWPDAAGIIAAFFAVLPYLVPPEATNKFIPRFLARHRKIISFAAALICFVIIQTRPWLHAKIPASIPFNIAVFIAVMLLAIRSWRISHTYSIPKYVNNEGVIWEIKDNVIVPDPACGKCHTRMLHSTPVSGTDASWQCPKCKKQYEWDKLTGSPQDAAAELVNSELRKRNMSADVIGWVGYYE